MDRLTPVECKLSDCMYFNKKSGDTMCYCSHKDKPYHMVEDVCPLYRKDWNKTGTQVDDLRKRFGIPGRK
ncbi:MAG: hypothetical protein ACLFUS_07530 [Candidatus Sumerlaeia bacterium]